MDFKIFRKIQKCIRMSGRNLYLLYCFSIAPTVNVVPEKIVVSEGRSVELRCDATGIPPPLIKWTKLNAAGTTDNIAQLGPILHISSIKVSDRGVYICVASNAHGLAQNSSTVEVESKQTLYLHRPSQCFCISIK